MCAFLLPLIVLLSESTPTEPWVVLPDHPFYFAVVVADAEASAEWYSATLGLDVLDDTTAPDGIWRILNLKSEHLFVEIIRDDRKTATDGAGRGFFKVGFGVPDVRDVADRVEATTGERPRVLSFPRHEIRLLQLQDPEGNTLQLFSPLEGSRADH